MENKQTQNKTETSELQEIVEDINKKMSNISEMIRYKEALENQSQYIVSDSEKIIFKGRKTTAQKIYENRKKFTGTLTLSKVVAQHKNNKANIK